MELSERRILVERASAIMHTLSINAYDALVEAEKQLAKEYKMGEEE